VPTGTNCIETVNGKNPRIANVPVVGLMDSCPLRRAPSPRRLPDNEPVNATVAEAALIVVVPLKGMKNPVVAGVGVGVGLGVALGLGVGVGVGVAVGTGVGVGVGVGDGVAVGTGEGVAVGTGVTVAVGTGVGVTTGASGNVANVPSPTTKHGTDRRSTPLTNEPSGLYTVRLNTPLGAFTAPELLPTSTAERLPSASAPSDPELGTEAP